MRISYFVHALLLAVFVFTTGGTNGQEPGTPRTAGLREVTTMAPGDVVTVADADLTIELVALGYRRCPPFARCPLADGPIIDYRVIRNSTGEELHSGESFEAPPDRFPYFVLSMGLEGEQAARFSVHRTDSWCDEYSSRMDQQACWSKVATLSADPAFCDRIRSDVDVRMLCIDNLAQLTERRDLCFSIASNSGWCGYQRAIGSLVDLSGCRQLLAYSQRQICFQEAYKQFGSTDMCELLPAGSSRSQCREAIAGIDARQD
jgi:hypothetical protein